MRYRNLVFRLRIAPDFKIKVQKLAKKYNLNLSQTIRKAVLLLESQGEK